MNSTDLNHNTGEKLLIFSIYRYFEFGGLQQDMHRLALELVERGFSVKIFCQQWEAPPPESGISFELIPPRGWSNHRRAINFQADLQKRLAGMSFRRHVTFNPIAFADWYYDGDMPFNWTHRRGTWRYLLSGRCRTFGRLEQEVFSGTAKIMTITGWQENKLKEVYAVDDSRLFRLPPGIDEIYQRTLLEREKLRTLRRRELNLPDGEILLVQVAGAFRTKGVSRTLTALAALPENVRCRVKLLLVGQGDIAGMRRLSGRLGIDNQVIFAGNCRGVREQLCAADLMVHPARNEAAGNVLLESIACGTPVICSGICGFSDYVKQSGGMVLHEPFAQAELDQRLQEILLTDWRLMELAAVCRRYAASADFYRRAAVAADLILDDHREEVCF